MALNEISTLATKELRQKAKLDLVALKRQGNVLNSDGTVYSTPLGSAQFNGSNQYLTVPANSALALSTEDFTVETWVYLSSAPGEYAVIDCEGTGQFGFLINSTDIVAFASVAEAYSFTSAVSASEWHHIAFCRVGTTLTCYLDGVSVGTPATTAYNFTSLDAFTIGRNPGANSQYLNGYLSNLRIVKGQALYTSNFTPLTSTLTAVAGTQLLLLNGTTEFVDGSSNQFTITNSGSVTLSTTAPTLTPATPAYRTRATYDITLLPTQYNNNVIIDNPNAGGLVEGRPWIETVSTFTFYEAFGTTTAISTTQYVSGNKIYAESSTYDVPNFQPARVIVNDISVVNTELRGHTLVVLDTYGDVVTAATQYDTWDTGGAPGARAALASALSAVASGNIVVLVSYDASGLDAGIRSAINTGYGSTNTNTWESSRTSHIFIGEKI
jgi:hypothetical protein